MFPLDGMFHKYGESTLATPQIKRSVMAGWAAGTLLVLTLALTFLLVVVLPEQARGGSALGMLGWVALAGGGTALALSWAGGGRPYPWLLISTSLHGWLTLLFCAGVWRLALVPLVGGLLTILFPVILPAALQSLRSGGEDPAIPQPRTALLTFSLLTVAHLIFFFSRLHPATRLFLVFLGVVSFLAAQQIRKPAATEARPSAGRQ